MKINLNLFDITDKMSTHKTKKMFCKIHIKSLKFAKKINNSNIPINPNLNYNYLNLYTPADSLEDEYRKRKKELKKLGLDSLEFINRTGRLSSSHTLSLCFIKKRIIELEEILQIKKDIFSPLNLHKRIKDFEEILNKKIVKEDLPLVTTITFYKNRPNTFIEWKAYINKISKHTESNISYLKQFIEFNNENSNNKIPTYSINNFINQ